MEPLKSIYYIGNPILDSPLIESLKMTCARSYGCFLNFLSNKEGLYSFLQSNILPKLSKISVTYPKSVK